MKEQLEANLPLNAAGGAMTYQSLGRTEVVCGEASAQRRLDAVVASLWPAVSLRTARRLVATGQALINGRGATPAHKVRSGDIITVIPAAPEPCQKPQELAVQGDFIFFYKQAGRHSARISGSPTASLESDIESHYMPVPTLLQRLDWNTAGLMLAGRTPGACQNYREAERDGQCQKTYLALLAGHMAASCVAKSTLHCQGGDRVRIGAKVAAEQHWTRFEPIAQGQGVTLATVSLRCGRRHQIRAHAASLGYPLMGDDLYGHKADGPYVLEQCALRFPGHGLTYVHPASRLWVLFPQAVETWLNTGGGTCT